MYHKQVVLEGQTVYLDILDTAGQEEFSSLREHYMRIGDAFLMVYSITNKASWDFLLKLRDSIYMCQDKSKTEEVAIVVVGNKSDMDSVRAVKKEIVEAKTSEWKVPFFEISAKARIGIDESWSELIRRVVAIKPKKPMKKKKNCTIL